jgi:hypothetical protein
MVIGKDIQMARHTHNKNIIKVCKILFCYLARLVCNWWAFLIESGVNVRMIASHLPMAQSVSLVVARKTYIAKQFLTGSNRAIIRSITNVVRAE